MVGEMPKRTVMSRLSRKFDYGGPGDEITTAISLNVVSGAAETSLRFACVESGGFANRQVAVLAQQRTPEQQYLQIGVCIGRNRDAGVPACTFEDDLRRLMALHI